MKTKFEDLIQHPLILKNLTQTMGFSHPTPIQKAVMPVILEGHDVYAGAQTGSGKTVAFLAPLIQRIFNHEIQMVLVLSPTRELVLQLDTEAMKLLEGQKEVVSIPLFGGVPTDPQILAYRHHRPRILIVTPGRMIEFIQEKILPLEQIEVGILDEADRMSDMGFTPQVSLILDSLPNRKQMLMFSATLPKELNNLMLLYFRKEVVKIQIDSPEQASDTLEHQVVFCSRRDKTFQLLKILRESSVQNALIFTRTRRQADLLFRNSRRTLKSLGLLHAGLDMVEREKTITLFREGRIQHLIATDVMARGIDIEHITHVIHYDLPESHEDYIHRSGRSGRAGRLGKTIALVEKEDRRQMERITQIAKKIQITTPRPLSHRSHKHQRPLRRKTSIVDKAKSFFKNFLD